MVADQTYAIGSLTDELRTDERLLALREAAKGLVSASGGRGFLLALAAKVDPRVKIDDQAFKDLVGFAPPTKIKLPQWADWPFTQSPPPLSTHPRTVSQPPLR